MIKRPKLERHSSDILNVCCCKKIGAHISAAGGVYNAFHNNHQVGGEAFACFLKSQRKWSNPDLKDDDVQKFNERSREFSFDKKFILPHGSYLINLANPDAEKRKRSYENFLDDLSRCQRLGISLYNFHPGSTVGECSIEEAIENIADCINQAHESVDDVIVVLETMVKLCDKVAGQRNIIGSKFEELTSIIDKVKDKSRIGVCIDTCHIFASGYDIRTPEAFEATMEKFERIVGFKYLKGVHLNDSKCELGSGKDRHENIGKGLIGLQAFKLIMKDSRFDNIPMVLETPASEKGAEEVYKQEIKLLYGLGEE